MECLEDRLGEPFETLRILLKSYLAEGYPSASMAASLMATSVRTLARRLSDRGLTYRELVDEVRFDVAREFLLESNAQISDIGREVGFEDPANFARIFRRVSGPSPLVDSIVFNNIRR